MNTVEVELPVYKAIGQFQTGELLTTCVRIHKCMICDLSQRVWSLFYAGKSKSDDLFDKLDTSKLNAHLKELMPGLTAKVFRTYNASITLDEMVCCNPYVRRAYYC